MEGELLYLQILLILSPPFLDSLKMKGTNSHLYISTANPLIF